MVRQRTLIVGITLHQLIPFLALAKQTVVTEMVMITLPTVGTLWEGFQKSVPTLAMVLLMAHTFTAGSNQLWLF